MTCKSCVYIRIVKMLMRGEGYHGWEFTIFQFNIYLWSNLFNISFICKKNVSISLLSIFAGFMYRNTNF
jgi:hypothetical protein